MGYLQHRVKKGIKIHKVIIWVGNSFSADLAPLAVTLYCAKSILLLGFRPDPLT